MEDEQGGGYTEVRECHEMSGVHPECVMARAVQPNELAALTRALPFGSRQKHAKRFALQVDRTAIYLIAWLDYLPVGHVLMHLHGPTEEAVARNFADCAALEDVFVHPDYRGSGIGSELVRAAETEIKQRGFLCIGFAVGVENLRARRFYKRLGYQEAMERPFLVSWEVIDSHGQMGRGGENCTFFVEELERTVSTRVDGLRHRWPCYPDPNRISLAKLPCETRRPVRGR